MLTPRWVRWFGIRNFLLGCFALDIVVFLLMKVFDSLGAWFVLRVLLGLIGSSLFTTSEAWISLLAGGAKRGRIIGIYAAALSAGFGLGPLLLSFTGIEGWPPFIANGIIVAVAAVPLLGAGFWRAGWGGRGTNPLKIFVRAPLIVIAVALFGLYEPALLALLPIGACRAGLSTDAAAATLSAVYIGAIVLQVPIGWLSDRTQRVTALRVCGAGGLVGALLVTTLHAPTPVLFGALFLSGGIVSEFLVAMGMAGDRFSGRDMVAGNAAIIMAYGLGSLIGPALGGAAMDVWNPQGLLAMFVVLFVVFLGMTVVGGCGRRGRTSRGPDPARCATPPDQSGAGSLPQSARGGLLYLQRRSFCRRTGPGGDGVFVEQLGQLLHHRAAEFLRINDRHRTAVVARDIVADADGDQLHLLAVLDVADHFAQVLFKVVAGVHR